MGIYQNKLNSIVLCSVLKLFLVSWFLDSEAAKLQEEWKELASKELEDWATRQAEQLEKTKTSNR